MRVITTAAALLAAASFAAPAAAQGSYHVRNDTGESQNCNVRYPGSQAAERIVLSRGGEWRGTGRAGRPRTMICIVESRTFTFRLEPGRTYTLTKTGAGTLILTGTD